MPFFSQTLSSLSVLVLILIFFLLVLIGCKYIYYIPKVVYYKKREDVLAAKSRESFKDAFGVASDGAGYGATLAIATLNVVKEVRDIFGEPQAIITIHDDCKLTLLPIPSYDILVGLVVELSVNVEDDKIVNKIERLVADTLVKPQ